MRRPLLLSLLAGVLALAVFFAFTDWGEIALGRVWSLVRGEYSVQERVEMHGADARRRLEPDLAAAGLPYPPAQIALVAIKARRELHLYARQAETDPWRYVRTYAVRAQSGTLGPKLREGDRQVPEGIYAAEYLNPNSRFHLSIRLDYPNAADRTAALAEGRSNLGSDIMIHGAAASVGCLAIGNEGAEDLFVLAALAGRRNVRIVVAPVDFRDPAAQPPTADKQWVRDLYTRLAKELATYPPPR